MEEQTDWEKWYRHRVGRAPDYSGLVEEVTGSAAERRSILHSYIEPTEEDREQGRKVPTAAHHAIAGLVSNGHIRVIVTTNFDRLIENALRERGVEPTIVASIDALVGAAPITHCSCYILKLHGDYHDARILNTDAELSGYPPQYDALLGRILDEYGLIVCGWSGEWDDALRDAIIRAPNRRYSMFWATLRDPQDRARELINHRRAQVIRIEGADSFFDSLQKLTETLEQTKRKDPLSVELLVARTKRFLAKEEHRIQLSDLFAEETDQLVERLNDPEQSPPSAGEALTFRYFVQSSEAATEALACMCGVLGRWGDGSEQSMVRDITRMMWAQAKKPAHGFSSYHRFRSYAAVLVHTAYGLGLTRARRWPELHQHFHYVVTREHTGDGRAVNTLFPEAWEGVGEDWQHLDCDHRVYVPLSNHLLILFSKWSLRFVERSLDFVTQFETYEGALAYLENTEKPELRSIIQNKPSGHYAPIGKVGIDCDNAIKIIKEFSENPLRESLLAAGFARRDVDIADLFVEIFRLAADEMRLYRH